MTPIFNFYLTPIFTRTVFAATEAGWFRDVQPVQPPLTDMGWEIFPQGLTEILTSLHQKYSLPPVFITENGAAMPDLLCDNRVQDSERVRYFQQHLQAVEQAIVEGVPVQGYFAWSLMDNFEWAEGYAKRFGIVYVDYSTQQRVLKDSGLALQQLFRYKQERAKR